MSFLSTSTIEYHFLQTDSDSSTHTNNGRAANSPWVGIFRRLYELLFIGIKPAPVSDNRELVLKRDMMAEITAVLMGSMEEDGCNARLGRIADFAPVIANMRFDRLPDMASNIRKRLDQASGRSASTKTIYTDTDLIPCTVCLKPLVGSYHILFPLDFLDGVRWILKVPETGHPDRFDDIAARALKSEAMTMRLLKRDTGIPVPEVFGFDASFDNALDSPFILMEFIQGIPLYEWWFDKSSSREVLEQRREQILRDVAKASVQLNRYTFDQGGAPDFGHEGNIVIGPLRILDTQAMLVRLGTDDPDETGIFRELGPYKDLEPFISCLLDHSKPPSDQFSQGVYKLLRLFIEWIPREDSVTVPGFVLTHPDFDIQNVLVSEEGRLCSLIDWDGVTAVPRCLGNERYPSWLTCDWNPARYSFKAVPPEGVEPGEETKSDKPEKYEEPKDPSRYENSPEELAFYRAMYQRIIASCIAERESDVQPGMSKMEAATKITRNSCIIQSLHIAATDPMSADAIVEKIFDEISNIDKENPGQQSSSIDEEATENGYGDLADDVDHEYDDLYLYDVACDLAEGKFDEGQLQRLKVGFAKLFS